MDQQEGRSNVVIRILKNNKGFTMLEKLILVALVASIAITVIPRVNTAFQNRTETNIEMLESTDTIVNE